MQKSLGKWKRICYYKGHIDEFTEKNASVKWLPMVPDLAIGEVKQASQAGIVGIRLTIHDQKNLGPIKFTDFSNWKTLKPKVDLYKVRAYIF